MEEGAAGRKAGLTALGERSSVKGGRKPRRVRDAMERDKKGGKGCVECGGAVRWARVGARGLEKGPTLARGKWGSARVGHLQAHVAQAEATLVAYI